MIMSFNAIKVCGAPLFLCLGLMTACGGAGNPVDALEGLDGVTGDADATVTTNDVTDDTGTADIPDLGRDVDVAADVGSDADACIPECGLSRCGPDGCGGSCGECPVGWECTPIIGYCAPPPCREVITEWFPAGVVNSLSFPTSTAEMQGCVDYTDDGDVDDGMMVMTSTLTKWANGFIDTADPAFILEFAGYSTGIGQQNFTLNVFAGEPTTPGRLGGQMYVDYDSYDSSTSCGAYVSFYPANVISNTLYAGPIAVTLVIPISEELALAIHPGDVLITAVVDVGENGVSSTDGVMSGIVYREEYLHILDMFATECAKDPVPEGVVQTCPNLAQFQEHAETMFDIHATEDGAYIAPDAEHPANAASFCAKFKLAPATIIGFTPPQWMDGR